MTIAGLVEHDPTAEAELGDRVLDRMYWENESDKAFAQEVIGRAANMAGTAREPTYYADLQEIRANHGADWSDEACREAAQGRQHARRLAVQLGVCWGTWQPLPGRDQAPAEAEDEQEDHRGAAAEPEERRSGFGHTAACADAAPGGDEREDLHPWGLGAHQPGPHAMRWVPPQRELEAG